MRNLERAEPVWKTRHAAPGGKDSLVSGCYNTLALRNRSRSIGVGVIVATQNPMDLDYRALSNAGLWCLGGCRRIRIARGWSTGSRWRASRRRGGGGRVGNAEIDGAVGDALRTTLQRLAPRWFLVRRDLGFGDLATRPLDLYPVVANQHAPPRGCGACALRRRETAKTANSRFSGRSHL
jgi:hypothetical protein